MSLVITPELVSAAALDLTRVGTAIDQAVATARGSTSSVAAAAADEVSTAIAALFSGHGEAFQAASAQAATFQEQFVQLLNGGAAQYASAEAFNNPLLAAINTPFQTILGRPLIGDGANGLTDANGVGTNGGAGGLLWGNGGRGGDSTAPGAMGGRGGAGGWLWGNGGRGGNGGPGEVVITGGVPVSASSAGTGGYGGSALLFGNGGAGGDGGPTVVIEDGVAHIDPLVGYEGRGGNAGAILGTGGAAGGGYHIPGVNRSGRNGLLGPLPA